MPRENAADAMVASAIEVHARGGPENFTIHAVVKESGRSLGSLYHHFGSFDGLRAEVYARCLAELLDTIVAAVVPCRSANGGIEALVRAYLAFTREHRDRALFVHAQAHASFVPAHGPAIAAARTPRLEALQAWLAPHVAGGRLIRLPAPLFEMLVVGPVAETARRWLTGDVTIDLDLAARLLPARIVRSVTPAPTARAPKAVKPRRAPRSR